MAKTKKIKEEKKVDVVTPETPKTIKDIKTSFLLKNGQTFTFTKERHGDKYLDNAIEFAETNKNIIID